MKKEDINKDFIKRIFYTSKGKINPNFTRESYLKKQGLYDIFRNYYTDCDEKIWIIETIYRILNDIHSRPICKMCGKPVKFGRTGYSNFCSPKCRNSNPDVLAKNRAGVSKSLKKAYAERGDEIKLKRSKTLGLDSSCGSPFVLSINQTKAKNTMIERYGVDNSYKMDKCKNKAKILQRLQSIEYQKVLGWDIEWVDILNSKEIIVHNCCDIHKDVRMTYSFFNNRTSGLHKRNCVLCPICNKEGHSNLTGIEIIIKKYLEELNVNYVLHDRKTIKPKEIDIYLPDYHIGIECNGIHWHSKEYNDNKPGRKVQNFERAHVDKRLDCELNGIRLIYFWEDRFLTNLDAIKGHIKQLVKPEIIKLFNNFELKFVDKNFATEFSKTNNIFEMLDTDNYLGLFVENDMLALYSFNILDNEIILSNITYKNGYKITNEILVFKEIAKLYDNIKWLLLNIDQDLYDLNYFLNDIGFELISKDIQEEFCIVVKHKNELCRYKTVNLPIEYRDKRKFTHYNSGIANLKLDLDNYRSNK